MNGMKKSLVLVAAVVALGGTPPHRAHADTVTTTTDVVIRQAQADAETLLSIRRALWYAWMEKYNAYVAALMAGTTATPPTWTTNVATLQSKGFLGSVSGVTLTTVSTADGLGAVDVRLAVSGPSANAISNYLSSVSVAADKKSVTWRVTAPTSYVAGEAIIRGKIARDGSAPTGETTILPNAVVTLGADARLAWVDDDGVISGLTKLTMAGNDVLAVDGTGHVVAAIDSLTGRPRIAADYACVKKLDDDVIVRAGDLNPTLTAHEMSISAALTAAELAQNAAVDAAEIGRNAAIAAASAANVASLAISTAQGAASVAESAKTTADTAATTANTAKSAADAAATTANIAKSMARENEIEIENTKAWIKTSFAQKSDVYTKTEIDEMFRNVYTIPEIDSILEMFDSEKYQIQRGTALIGRYGNSTRLTVNFPTAFKTVPTVVATLNGSYPAGGSHPITIEGITKTRFTMTCYAEIVVDKSGAVVTTPEADWIAIAEK